MRSYITTSFFFPPQSQSAMSKPSKSAAIPIETLPPVIPQTETTTFDGTHPDLFLLKLRLTFSSSPSSFATDESKSLHLLNCLRGSALEWASHVTLVDQTLTKDYDRFSTALLKNFQRPDKSQTAMMQLSNLHQGGDSVDSYAQRFKEIARSVPWNESALIHQFRLGLNSNLKDEMVGHDYPPSLQEMITLTLRFEERLAERAQERLWESRMNPLAMPQSFPFTTPQANTKQRDAPDFWSDLPEHRKTYITRYALGNCVFCGSSEHRVANCPSKKPRPEGKGQAQSQK